MERDEPTLFADASRGDADAVEELVRRHYAGLLAYVRRRGGGLPRAKESATDIVQSVCREVLTRLADRRLEYRGEAEFRAWLYEAALLKVRGRRRYWAAARRDPALERRADPGGSADGADATGIGAGLAGSDASPSAAAAEREELERARAALATLPERYRQVIELARVEGLGHREIAARMGITEANSRMLLSRALARLATAFERDDAR